MGDVLGNLGINALSFIWQLAAFLVLLFVLWHYAFGPVTRMLDERANRIRQSMDTAERVQREMAEMEQRSKQLLDESRRERQATIAEAQQIGDRIKADAQANARRQHDEIVASAQQDIQRATNEARLELRREVVDLAITAASKVVRRELDHTTHYQLINDVLAESGSQPNSDGGRPVA